MTTEEKIADRFFERKEHFEMDYREHRLQVTNGLNYRMILIFGNRVLARKRFDETTFEWIGYTKDFDELRIVLNQYVPKARTIDDLWGELW